MPGAERFRGEAVSARPGRFGRALICAEALVLCAMAPAPAFAHVALERQIEDLTARIAGDPREATLYLRRGELHRAHADWDAAAADYGRARAIDPHLDVVDYYAGRMLFESGQPAEATRTLGRFLAKHPDHPGALTIRARALTRLGRQLEAAQDYARAISQYQPPHTPDPDLYLNRAQALVDVGESRIDEAIQGLDEGMSCLGPLVSLGFYAIDLEVRLHRFDAALERLERLAARSPRQESYLMRRGSILEAAGRPEEARRAYEQVLAAIKTLPPERRATGALTNFETTARAALERLGAPDSPPGGKAR